ncbi:MAG: GNAT family N-acetyltransferase [Pseudomonadota bacterium]
MNTRAADLERHSFRGLDDLAGIKAFLQGREQPAWLPDYWTAGKSMVGTFQTILDSPSHQHSFWSDQRGVFQAYLWVHPEASETIEGNGNAWRMLIHPPFRHRALATEILSCAEAQLAEISVSSTEASTVETVAYGQDHWLSDLLGEHGYSRREALDVYLRRGLQGDLEAAAPVDGFTIRPLDAEQDVLQRAAVQRDAFAGVTEPDDWSIANTRRFLTWYQGREDLDLVAVSDQGEIGAFAVFLVDSGTLIGELDPVGTRTAHQRKGLSKALLLTGLQYLKSKGMRAAAVRTGVENTPAIRAYESVGFRVVDHLYRYVKTDDGEDSAR